MKQDQRTGGRIRTAHVGFCIYCRSRKPPLKKEHVLPLALRGGLILLEASCEACEKITHQFERTCMRPMFGNFRMLRGYPTRRRSERPKTVGVEVEDATGYRQTLQVPVKESPAMLVLPVMDPPRLVSGIAKPIVDGPWRGKFFIHTTKEFQTLMKKHGLTTVEFGGYLHFPSFVRLLAKVAHAGIFIACPYHVNLKPLLTDLILGKTDEYDLLIGGAIAEDLQVPMPKGETSFRYSIETGPTGTRYLVLLAQLFAKLDAPTYKIVVGIVRPDTPLDHSRAAIKRCKSWLDSIRRAIKRLVAPALWPRKHRD